MAAGTFNALVHGLSVFAKTSSVVLPPGGGVPYRGTVR
jgi:hypothetical protein